MREPSLRPVFGKLGVKAPVAVAAPVQRGQVADRMREFLAVHGGFALKFSIVVWMVVVLAAVFFIVQA